MNKNGATRIPFIFLFSILLSLKLFARHHYSEKDSLRWLTLENKKYTLHFTETDKTQAIKIDSYLESGLNNISGFFHHPYPVKLNVYIFPKRKYLDIQWQKDWNDSTFQSQCWMVGSGVAYRLDLLSPGAWAKEACDHDLNDTTEIRQITWHELTHVFHGQYNPDHTLSNIEKLGWLVEGVATFASGQLDERRVKRIKQMIADNKTPSTLDDFWKGQEKYGLSGSIVAFIDKKYGRNKLFELLKLANKQEALKLLGLSEDQLIKDWKSSFQMS